MMTPAPLWRAVYGKTKVGMGRTRTLCFAGSQASGSGGLTRLVTGVVERTAWVRDILGTKNRLRTRDILGTRAKRPHEWARM